MNQWLHMCWNACICRVWRKQRRFQPLNLPDQVCQVSACSPLDIPCAHVYSTTSSIHQFQPKLKPTACISINMCSLHAVLAHTTVLVSLSDYLIRVFGQPHKFSPQPTHVLLVGVCMQADCPAVLLSVY